MSKEASKQRTKTAPTAAVPLIDNRLIPKPLQVRPGEPCSITVNISGLPPPNVRWQIGRKRVKESAKYQLTTDGGLGHTLVIARATEDLEQGVWVVASNEHGEDCCRIEVSTQTLLNEVEMSGRRNRRPPVSSTSEMKQKTSLLRKKKTRRVGETQSVASLDAWGTGSTTGSNQRLPSVDDIRAAPDDSLVATPSDLNQSLDSEAIIPGRKQKRTRQKPSRFSSTDAIYSGGSLSLPPARQDSYSSVVTVDAIGPATDRGTDDSVFLGTGTETPHPSLETATKTKKKKSSVRKKVSGSRSSLASNSGADASNEKNNKETRNAEVDVKVPEKTSESEEKISDAKETVTTSFPVEKEDGKLLWELFGVNLNRLCKRLLTDLQSNLDAKCKEETEAVTSIVQDQQTHDTAVKQQQQQQQQQESSVDDEEELIRLMVENRQIPVTDLDDFYRDEGKEKGKEEGKAHQIATEIDEVEGNLSTLERGRVYGWNESPAQASEVDISDAQSRTRPTEETAHTMERDIDKMTEANVTIPSIAIYDAQGSMVNPTEAAAENIRKLDKRKPQEIKLQERKLDKAQPIMNEPDKREPDKKEHEKKKPEIKVPEKKEPERKESEEKEPQKELKLKEPEKKAPVIKDPKKDEPKIKEPEKKEPVIKDPKKDEPKIKEPEKKAPVIKEPKKDEPKIKESEKNEPVIKEPKKDEPKIKEPEKKAPVIKEPKKDEPEIKEPERKQPDIKEAQKSAPVIKEPEMKEPKRPEPEKRNEDERKPDKIEQKQKELDKRDPDNVKAIEDKQKNRCSDKQSEIKPSTPIQVKHSSTTEIKSDVHRMHEKPPSGKKTNPTSTEDDHRTARSNDQPGYKPVPTPRKRSSTGGSDPGDLAMGTHEEHGAERSGEAPPVPQSAAKRDATPHNGNESVTYSWQRERAEKSDVHLPDSIQKSKTDTRPTVLTTYILHNGNKSHPTPKDGHRTVNKEVNATDGNSLNDSRPPIPDNKNAVSSTASKAINRQPSSPAANVPIVPERARRPPTAANERMATERHRSQSADRVDTKQQDYDRKLIVVDIDIDDQQDRSRADLQRGSTNLYRSASGDLPTVQGAAGTNAAGDSPQTPVPKPRQRISLKPARSEEFLATKFSGSTSSRTNQASGSHRMFLRGAKSVDSLTSAGSEATFTSRIGRRTMSKEWEVVTVTTTTEEIVVTEQSKDKTESNQRSGLAPKKVKEDQRNDSDQRTDLVSKEVKGDQRNESDQRTDLVSKEVKDDHIKEESPAITETVHATQTVEDKDKLKESKEEVCLGLVEHKPNEVKKETKDDDLGERSNQVSEDSETEKHELPLENKEEKLTQLSEDVNIIVTEEQPKQDVNITALEITDNKQEHEEQLDHAQTSKEALGDAQTSVPAAEADKAIAAKEPVLEEPAKHPTYVSSAVIILKGPKLKDDSGKPNRYLDAGASPGRPRLESQDSSTQTDEDLTELERQMQMISPTNKEDPGGQAIPAPQNENEAGSEESDRKKSLDSERSTKTVCTAVVYEYGEIISFILDTESGISVEPPTAEVERIRLEPEEPVTALVTDNRNFVVLSAAANHNIHPDKGEEDNAIMALPNRNLDFDSRSRVTRQVDDDSRPAPPILSSNSADSDPLESPILLRSSQQGAASLKRAESNAEDHKLPDSLEKKILPAAVQSTATNDAIENQSSVSLNRLSLEINSDEKEEPSRTDEALQEKDDHQLNSFQECAAEGQDPDQSDEESHQSSVSSEPSCESVVQVATKVALPATPNTPLSDYVQLALPTSSLQPDRKVPPGSDGNGTDDDEMVELESDNKLEQDDSRFGQYTTIQDQTDAETGGAAGSCREPPRQDEEDAGAVGGIAIALKEVGSAGSSHGDAANGNRTHPRRPSPPDRSRVESTDEMLAEKACVQSALSSLGTIIFLAVAAIIFHFLNNIVGDQME